MVDEYCCMSEKRIKGKMTREVSLRKKKKEKYKTCLNYLYQCIQVNKFFSFNFIFLNSEVHKSENLRKPEISIIL